MTFNCFRSIAFISAIMFIQIAPASTDSGKALIDPCLGPDIIRIQRPFYPGKKDSPSFSYAFRLIRKNLDPQAPTLIYLPGGPGEASIDDRPSSYPSTMNIIETDPRGVGCNALPGGQIPPLQFFSTANLASDVLAMIRFLELKNYVIKGVSYGTVLATTVAYRAESGEAFPPQAIVLDGVLGRSFYGDESFSGFFDEWSKVKKQLSTEVISQLNQINESRTLLSMGPDDWGAFIQLELYAATLPGVGNLPMMMLSMLSSSTNPALPGTLGSSIATVLETLKDSAPEAPSSEALHLQILCSELVEHTREGLTFLDGDLVAAGKEYCQNIHLTAPYDSSKMQIHIPIIYVTGEDDPATPAWQAYYHFQTQKQTKRYFILEKGAGHAAMNSYLSDCLPQIWSEITRGTFQIDDVLKTCKNPTTLKIAFPD